MTSTETYPNAGLIEEALEEHRESLAAIENLGLRPLGPGLKTLIWGLRIYVVFMAVIVVINVVETLH